jgi:hypothetical protein
MAAPGVLSRRLAVDGQFWGLSSGASASLIAIPFAGAALLPLVSAAPGIYNALVREDSVLEWVQLGAYLVAAAYGAFTALRLRRDGNGTAAAAFAVFALCGLLAAGEEISWGQRLFGFGTPNELKAVNNQEELNVHDVVELQGKINLALALASLYGLASPWLVRGRSLLVPPLALGGAFFAMLAYTVARAAFFPHPGHELAKYSEWPETCFAGALALFAALAWHKARPGK